MRTITIHINAERPPFYTIPLGRRGENEATQVVFDVSQLISTYGEGTAQLAAKLPNDSTPYPVSITQEGNTVTWLVTNADTQAVGNGECEMFWYVGDVLAKSVVYTTVIGRDIGDVGETPPDPYETWVEEVLAAAAEITGMTAEAETLPAGSDPTASYADGVLTIGIPSGGSPRERRTRTTRAIWCITRTKTGLCIALPWMPMCGHLTLTPLDGR